ncbi:MAG: asparaginase [Gemmatimonadota bacterium]|nr:asparaginase [Gemmatimonadota bacterium]
MDELSLDIVVTRGATVESVHRVHAAVVNATGARIGFARDAGLMTHWRSCAKPFQVMSLLEQGGFDAIGWGDDQLAIACGSHGGEPEHVALAASMLASLGMEEGDLACGPHDPLSARGEKLLRESGERSSRLHNNCSGKHAAMLARAHTASWPTMGYERFDHPVQQECLAQVAKWTDQDPTAIPCAVDGCGVVEFALPLSAMALAYARLADGARRSHEIPSRIVHAMQTRPFLVGGSDRFDSALIAATEGRVIAKVGAEGVHSLALVDEGVGIAVKVECGAQRAQFPAVIAVLQRLGALPDLLPARLAEFARKTLRNTRGEVVGEVRPMAG